MWAVTDDEQDYDTQKSDIQREKFHAMIGDIQKTGVIVLPFKKIIMNKGYLIFLIKSAAGIFR